MGPKICHQSYLFFFSHETFWCLSFSCLINFAAKGPRVDTLLVPLKGKHGVILRSISIVKPSSWFSFLSGKPGLFKALILGSTSDKDRVKFWAGARQIEEMAFLTPPEEIASQHAPFKLHGDKGPYYKNKTLQVFSISSIFAHAADSTLSRLAVCCFAALVFFIFSKLEMEVCFFFCSPRHDSGQISGGHFAYTSWNTWLYTELLCRRLADWVWDCDLLCFFWVVVWYSHQLTCRYNAKA